MAKRALGSWTHWIVLVVIVWESLVVVVAMTANHSTTDISKCEKLNTTLTYSQENAPKDISAVVREFLLFNLSPW